MASLLDSVYVFVSSHTHSPDGTTRSDFFQYQTDLTNYTTGVRAMATPLYNQVASERTASGGPATNQIQNLPGTAAGGQCDLFFRLGLGQDALATPIRYHMSWEGNLAGGLITSPGDVFTYLTGAVSKLIPNYLYNVGNY